MVARAMISTASHPTTTIYGGAVSFPMTRGVLALITDSRFAWPIGPASVPAWPPISRSHLRTRSIHDRLVPETDIDPASVERRISPFD